MWFDIRPFGENALLLSFKQEISKTIHLQVKEVYRILKNKKIPGVTGFIPAYCSITIAYNPYVTNFKKLSQIIDSIPFKGLLNQDSTKKIMTIPVCYDLGMDLENVAQKKRITKEEVIAIHTAKPYLVYMLGFLPGFMYLGGLDSRLHVPRKKSPRLKVKAGSVGLADRQTGIYPFESPGGWQIIGETPISLFKPDQTSLVAMGDYVQFRAIDIQEFNASQENDRIS